MTPDDKVEVIIPTRNAPEVLWLTLTHLLAFNGGWVSSVTLLDNVSKALGMPEVLAFARRHGCNVIRHEGNVGVWASVNRGLALSRSRWVLVLTSDVLLGPGAVPLLRQAAIGADVPFLGPQTALGMASAPVLALPGPAALEVDTSTYNGAVFLMDWPRLREKVGWFDPRFYCCAGDTDFVERMRDAGVPYGVLLRVPCVHLDKQSRRRDNTVLGDTRMEIEDLSRFRAKWAGRDDVLARHPLPNMDSWNAMKGGQVGWEATIPR